MLLFTLYYFVFLVFSFSIQQEVMLNGVLHVLSIIAYTHFSLHEVCAVHNVPTYRTLCYVLYLCFRISSNILRLTLWLHRHQMTELINQKFCSKWHAIWGRCVCIFFRKIYATEGKASQVKARKRVENQIFTHTCTLSCTREKKNDDGVEYDFFE